MERRTVLTLAAPSGLLVGAVIWLLTGGVSAKLEALQTRLSDLPRPRASVARGSEASIGQALAAPIFDLLAGAALKEISVKLEGIARVPGRAAALLSIDGAAAQWLEVGETLGGISLEDLTSNSAVIETPSGRRDLALGSLIGPAPTTAPPASMSPAAVGSDQPPPGFKGPPPPASAPGVAP